MRGEDWRGVPDGTQVMVVKRPTKNGPDGPTLRTFLHDHGLSRAHVATLLHVGEERVNHWCLPPESKGHRPMPLAYWELLLVRLTHGTPVPADA